MMTSKPDKNTSYTALPVEDEDIPLQASCESQALPQYRADTKEVIQEEGVSFKDRHRQTAHSALIIAIWISLSSAVIVYNKYILDDKTGLNFRYPVFLTTFHMVFATIGTRLLARFTSLLDRVNEVEMTTEQWRKSILPIGALFSASLVTSNVAYLTLTVSFIQMLKAFTPVAVLFISFAFKLKELSLNLMAIVVLISTGVAIASYGEVAFEVFGFLAQVLAVIFESSRLVLIQVLLQNFKMDPLVSLYYFAPVCASFNTILLMGMEGWHPFEEMSKLGPAILLSNALIAFCLNISAVFLIDAASSLVLTLSGVVKDLLLVFGSTLLFHTKVSPLQYIGYGIALLGLVLFKLNG